MCQLQPLIERLEPMNNEASPALDPQQVAEALSFACEAATEAGTIALSYFRRALNVHNKLDDGRFDPVTQADREVESFLRDKLGRRFPEFGIIGEEEGVKPGRSNVNWVIDPIDGTKAFISGFPTWGILLGLQQAERALAGLMYQPVTGELFFGSVAGSGLRWHGKTVALQTRPTQRLEDAILYCTHESMFVDEANLAAAKFAQDGIRTVTINMEHQAFDQGLAQQIADATRHQHGQGGGQGQAAHRPAQLDLGQIKLGFNKFYYS